ncbi:MAG: bacteriocin [Crocinitomicaceae bacterium]
MKTINKKQLKEVKGGMDAVANAAWIANKALNTRSNLLPAMNGISSR